jgi:hypothetical protein
MPAILFSTNPWYAGQVATLYRGGVHIVWCSDYYDSATAPPGSAAAAAAPSSSPKGIFDALRKDCDAEEEHSALISRYRKTFRRLATEWFADGSINMAQRNEIIAVTKSATWRTWRPCVYLIPRAPIAAAGRLITVPRRMRANIGPEFQINDLMPHEFDSVEW